MPKFRTRLILAFRGAICLLSIVGGCARSGGTLPPSDRAAAYLLARQETDGSWRSEAHGIARGGFAWTPYIADVLFRFAASRGHAAPPEILRAADFVRDNVDADGALGRSNLVLEYPNYATSYALALIRRLGNADDRALVDRMVRYLASQQWTAARGITPDHPASGGWGFGETRLPDGSVGHVDLSHTRRALEGLGDRVSDETAREAMRFLALVQKHPDDSRVVLDEPQNRSPFDGGFYASPVVFGTNKAGIGDGPGGRYFRSYATATCDGIMALVAAGVPAGDERIRLALSWLDRHAMVDRVAGIPPEEPGQWEDVMYFYHLNVLAEVLVRFRPGSPLIAEIRKALGESQRPDGSFSNPLGGANKEDDPLLATAFALAALTHLEGTRPAR